MKAKNNRVLNDDSLYQSSSKDNDTRNKIKAPSSSRQEPHAMSLWAKVAQFFRSIVASIWDTFRYFRNPDAVAQNLAQSHKKATGSDDAVIIDQPRQADQSAASRQPAPPVPAIEVINSQAKNPRVVFISAVASLKDSNPDFYTRLLDRICNNDSKAIGVAESALTKPTVPALLSTSSALEAVLNDSQRHLDESGANKFDSTGSPADVNSSASSDDSVLDALLVDAEQHLAESFEDESSGSEYERDDDAESSFQENTQFLRDIVEQLAVEESVAAELEINSDAEASYDDNVDFLRSLLLQ